MNALCSCINCHIAVWLFSFVLEYHMYVVLIFKDNLFARNQSPNMFRSIY